LRYGFDNICFAIELSPISYVLFRCPILNPTAANIDKEAVH
jgi:hypothetical protein